jgi:hypothetical protein
MTHQQIKGLGYIGLTPFFCRLRVGSCLCEGNLPQTIHHPMEFLVLAVADPFFFHLFERGSAPISPAGFCGRFAHPLDVFPPQPVLGEHYSDEYAGHAPNRFIVRASRFSP